MDIRNFFGHGLSKNSSALSEVRSSHGSPVRRSKKSVESEKIIKKKSTFDVSSSSDEENPIPKSLRRKKANIKEKRKITISSDEDDIPGSVPKQQPGKRSEKIVGDMSAKKRRKSCNEDSANYARERKRPPKATEEKFDEMKFLENSGGGSGCSHSVVTKKPKNEQNFSIKAQLQVEEASVDKKKEKLIDCMQKKHEKVSPEVHSKRPRKNESKEAKKISNSSSLAKKLDGTAEGKVITIEKRETCEKKLSVSLPWVDKYKPTTIKQIVGQNGEKSPLNKLLKWLKEWPKYHLGEGAKQKRPKPPPWLAQADGTSFKAALLSGPPGVGKTTCASLACKELGLQCVEMNASDARNKKMLDTHVAELLRSQQILRYFGKSANCIKANYSDELTHVLIMDEVDGMSGNEDRAGLSQLMQMIKGTKVPIICICNDRQSSKMRNLVNYCFDLRFPRPRVEQIRPRIQTIAFQEKLKVSKEEVDEIIEASNHDVRQTIYNLQLLSRGMDKHIEKKDVAMNLFEAARLLLNAGTTIVEKQRMFFVDYSMMPLFIQENYLLVVSSKLHGKERLNAIRNSAEAISNGDLIDKVIRNGGSWSLLNEQGLFSSVVPSLYMGGYLRSMISFPSWLGKNSSAVKHQRLLRQLESHAFQRISTCRSSLVTEYVPFLRDALSLPLIQKENEGAQEVIGVLDEYDLTRDDLDEIVELGTWPGLVDFKKNIQTKVKSFFTRTYNKHSHLLPYALEDVSRKRGRVLEYNLDEEGNLVEVENEDELNENDKSDSEFGVTESKPKPLRKKARGESATGSSPCVSTTGKKEPSKKRGRVC